MSLGLELVVNGGFNEDISEWTTDTWEWLNFGGREQASCPNLITGYIKQTITSLVAGKTYQLRFYHDGFASPDKVEFGGDTIIDFVEEEGGTRYWTKNIVLGVTNKEIKFTKETIAHLTFLDDVSVKEVIADSGGISVDSFMDIYDENDW